MRTSPLIVGTRDRGGSLHYRNPTPTAAATNSRSTRVDLAAGTLKNATVLDVSRFLDGAGDSLGHFRYYASRPYEIIQRHLTTRIFETGEVPVAYGHLDPEAGHVWLGLCVAEAWRGQGHGSRMLEQLLLDAVTKKVACLRLTVDQDNPTAVRLYHRHGFLTIDEQQGKVLMERVQRFA